MASHEADHSGEPSAKKPRVDASTAEPALPDDDDLFDLLDDVPVEECEVTAESAEETARRTFAEGLSKSRQISADALPGLLAKLQDEAPQWGTERYRRSVALLLAYVARSGRVCRTAFVGEGMSLLGSLLSDSVAVLEGNDMLQRQAAADWALACLACLKMLPIGRATMWEHRQAVGKAFDRLHKWCGAQRSHIAAEIRAPMEALCRRWRRQPRPAAQDKESGAQRQKVVQLFIQGLAVTGSEDAPPTPAVLASPKLMPLRSPMPIMSPLASPGEMAHLPHKTTAAEIEAELYSRFGGFNYEYKQHARMLRANLAHPLNGNLRERVLSGDLSPADLVAMESRSLAPEELQKERKERELKAMEAVVDKEGPPRSPRKDDDSDKRDQVHMAMAPPPSPPPEKSYIEKEEDEDTGAGDAAPPPPRMLPPPTPFLRAGDDSGSAADMHDVTMSRMGKLESIPEDGAMHPPPSPDVLATPAAEEEDETTSLIQRLSQAP